jgi:hypothetical protein
MQQQRRAVVQPERGRARNAKKPAITRGDDS